MAAPGDLFQSVTKLVRHADSSVRHHRFAALDQYGAAQIDFRERLERHLRQITAIGIRDRRASFTPSQRRIASFTVSCFCAGAGAA